MSEGRGATLLGGLAVALCPLVCLGLPLLVAAAIGAGLALAVGVAAGVALAGLGVGAFLALRRRDARRPLPAGSARGCRRALRLGRGLLDDPRVVLRPRSL